MSRETNTSQRAVTEAGASVLLSHEGTEVSSVLLRALTARGLAPMIVHDEPSAMLAFAESAGRDLSRRVLIVIEPTRWDRVDELGAAVRAYHDSVHCWQFDAADGAVPKLSQLAATVSQPAGGQAGGGHGPVGRIRKRTRPVDRLLVSPGQELSTREVVTQQELTMLLGPAPGEAG